MVGLFVVNLLLAVATRSILGTPDLLIFIPIILGSMLWVSKKIDESSEQVNIPVEENSKGFKIKNYLKITILSLAVLISIFFVVFANIQTELAKEQQQMSEQLAEEAVQLQKRAIEEAARALAERQELQQQLDQCRTGE